MPFNYKAFKELINLVDLSPRDLSKDIGKVVEEFGAPISPNTIEAIRHGSFDLTVNQMDKIIRYSDIKGYTDLNFYNPPE